MCGISGIWKRGGGVLEEASLHRFNDSLIHRGPDGKGIHIFPNGLGLAQRRLSILDVSEGGAQPMADATGRYHITYNGEVFNFIELKDELSALGFSFKSDSDTEVILAAYVRWGMECFHRFNGMWAIGIYDSEEQSLLLCRDRYGIKPLYYLHTPQQFAFASETNAFQHLDGHTRSIHEQRLQIALQEPYALEGRGYTIYQDIYQLLPGHCMRITAQANTPRQERWYDIAARPALDIRNYDEQVERYRELLREACALRMRSDVSLATALSGGVDSTAVYSMVHALMKTSDAQRVPEDWQRAFVAVFPGTVQDETAYAEAAVAYTGGQAEYLDATKQGDLLGDILKTTRHFDAISSTPLLALTTVYQGMRQHGVTVSLDGHGVDEMLYGYRKMVYDALEYHKWEGNRADADRTAEVLLGLYAPDMLVTKGKSIRAGIDQAFAMRKSPLAGLKRGIKRLKGAPKAEIKPSDLLVSLSDKPYDFSSMNAFDRMVHEEFFLDTLPSLLRNFDKAAMMHSIEIRMPFMDYRMVEYAFNLPYEAKLGGGYTKRILRDAMKGVMPEENRARTFKVGLAAPTMEWFQGPLSEWVSDTLASQAFQQESFRGTDVSKAMRAHVDQQDWSVANAAETWKHLNAHILIHGG